MPSCADNIHMTQADLAAKWASRTKRFPNGNAIFPGRMWIPAPSGRDFAHHRRRCSRPSLRQNPGAGPSAYHSAGCPWLWALPPLSCSLLGEIDLRSLGACWAWGWPVSGSLLFSIKTGEIAVYQAHLPRFLRIARFFNARIYFPDS